MGELPSGAVTFCFTDIEGSTRLLQHLGESAYAAVLADHHRLIAAAITGNDGVIVSTEGDGVFAAFAEADQAVAACRDAQIALAEHGAVRVRMGLHTGQAEPHDNDYVALAVHQAARVSSAGHGGQVIVSAATRDAAEGHSGDLSLQPLGAYRLKDFDDPQELFQLCHPDLAVDFPPLRAPSMQGHGLAVARTSFVGRDDESVTLEKLLQLHRVVTVVGPGGVGKSRLASRIAVESLVAFADGLAAVHLEPIGDAALVLPTLAGALGLREEAGRPLADTIADHVRGKAMLVLLDNCEHVVESAAAAVNVLLDAGPDIVVLATSRERLGVAGEQVFPLTPLPLPSDAGLGIEHLLEYDSVRLFVARATLLSPSFALTDANAEAVVHICRQLDGMPLALELAAARTKALNPSQLAARLDDRFKLLDGVKAATERTQTLREVVDWSYDLLNDDEKRVFARLAVFAGGFPLEMAEFVCAGDGIDEADVLDHVFSLVEKSLIGTEERGSDLRYRMLETVRAYAEVKLGETGTADMWRERFVDACIERTKGVQSMSSDLGDRRGEWMARVEAEEDNVRAALDWALSNGRTDPALLLAQHVWSFWWDKGRQEGMGWLRRSLEARRDLDELRGWSLYGLGLLCFDHDPEHAATCYAEMIQLGEQLGDAMLLKSGLHGAADAAGLLGKHDEAIAGYARARAVALELGDMEHSLILDRSVAQVQSKHGRFEAALLTLERVQSELRLIGSPFEVARTNAMIGEVHLAAGAAGAAVPVLCEALDTFIETGNSIGTVSTLLGLASAASALDRSDEAAFLVGAAQEAARVGSIPLAADERLSPAPELVARGAQLSLAEALGVARGLLR